MTELVHLSRMTPFRAVCGADEANQRSTRDPAGVTCSLCRRLDELRESQVRAIANAYRIPVNLVDIELKPTWRERFRIWRYNRRAAKR